MNISNDDYRPRYYFEHRLFRNLFFSEPNAVVSYLAREGSKAFFEIERFLLTMYDIPLIEEYDGNVNVEVPENDKCVHISLAEPVDKLDCTDIVLYCDDASEARYLTVEYDVADNVSILLPCEWIDRHTHGALGTFRHKRDRVLKMLYRELHENNRDYQATVNIHTDK